MTRLVILIEGIPATKRPVLTRLFQTDSDEGCVPEWPNGADCKSAAFQLRWFESIRTHNQHSLAGVAQSIRALAFQAGGRGFESRFPLIETQLFKCDMLL